MPIHRANPILPITAASSSAQSTNGITAIPMTDTASSTQTGPASSMTSRPVMNADSGVARSVVVARPHRRIEHEVQQQVDEEEDAGDRSRPMPATARSAAPAAARASATARSPRSRAPRPAVPMTTWWPTGIEPRGALEAADDEEVLAHLRALGDHRRAADDHERSVDDGGARESRLAEHDDDVAVDAAFDDRVAGDHHHFARDFVGLERVVLADPEGRVSSASGWTVPLEFLRRRRRRERSPRRRPRASPVSIPS